MDARTEAGGDVDGAARDVGGQAALTRRALLAGSASALAIGAAGSASAQSAGPAQVPDFGGWFGGETGGETTSFTGVDDRRGESSVTIEVGAGGNGGTYAFAPTAVWVDPGTTITFQWTSDTHNVVVEDQPDGAGWDGHEPIENSGFSFDASFETTGIYTYYCNPHLTLGMKGGIAVGDDVPMAAPPSAGGEGGFTPPGGTTGVAFMGLLLGTVGVASAIVLAGELHGSVTQNTDGGPTSAHTTALLAMGVGLVALVAVVTQLLIG